MRVIIFDLDLTLAATEECHAYLRTRIGRESVVEALQSKTVDVSFYSSRLVRYVNALLNNTECCVIVVSDSPKDYCVEVLKQGGYKISERWIFGSQSKPLVLHDAIADAVAEEYEVLASSLSYLVVGDSPKDIYYAHHIASPSIFVSWGSKQSTMAHHANPTYRADKIQDLEKCINVFLSGKLAYKPYDFKKDYLVLDPQSKEFRRTELPVERIGYGKEYVKNKDDYRDIKDVWASNELRWVVKQAKNLSKAQHEARVGTPLFGKNGLYSADPFKSKAGHFKNDFIRWCERNNIKGNVLLVPVPPSVPRECNLTHSMSIMSHWWEKWINSEDHGLTIKVHDIFERFWPKVPSHQSSGWRDMDDQFATLGLFLGLQKKVNNAHFVVIIDDVVTSGSHINAIASFVRTLGLVDSNVQIYGYALFKTIKIEAANDIDMSWLDDL